MKQVIAKVAAAIRSVVTRKPAKHPDNPGAPSRRQEP